MPDDTLPSESSAVILARMEVKLDHALASQADHEQRIRVLEDKKTVSPFQLWTVTASGVATLGVIAGLASKIIGG
ncbi:MAG TPA: hypothetical protein VGD51_08865 [Nocardioidaceae bacterium]